mmetsp:Transcript_3836/g.11444  ORF Transcript_3836/g.11444 Transcript_3836/m.11444 type:complete len:207 (-) Transcript_3836:590-1210(-)
MRASRPRRRPPPPCRAAKVQTQAARIFCSMPCLHRTDCTLQARDVVQPLAPRTLLRSRPKCTGSPTCLAGQSTPACASVLEFSPRNLTPGDTPPHPRCTTRWQIAGCCRRRCDRWRTGACPCPCPTPPAGSFPEPRPGCPLALPLLLPLQRTHLLRSAVCAPYSPRCEIRKSQARSRRKPRSGATAELDSRRQPTHPCPGFRFCSQ